jgi:DNA-binding winged helix-turn-helix (wHTH) protein
MVVRFGAVEIDLDRIEIRVDGDLQRVQPQVFDVIRYLYERRERLVTKEELLDNVWGSRFVSETTLTSRIKSARRVLGDTGRDQVVIRTVHGRGYRFVAEPDGAEPGPRALAPLVPPPALEPAADGWPMVGRFELLDRIVDELAVPEASGVVLVGPAGIGKTRAALEVLDRRSSDGVPTHRVTASVAAAAIPLAALVPLVGASTVEARGVPADVTRSAMFHGAVAELIDRSERLGRSLVMVDDIDRLDELSVAVLAAAMDAGAVSVLGTWRPSPVHHPFEELVRAGRLREIEVPGLDETDVDVVLYRVLGGPIDLGSLERLAVLSCGRPGLLRDLVESSRQSGALVRDEGVWRLVGPVRSTAAEHWPVAGLESDAQTGAELLSLVVDLHVDDAEHVIGERALDALDAARLLMLERAGDDLVVRLADPLLAETIASRIGPIRARRHRATLADALSRGRKRPQDLAAIVRWADELDRPLDPADVLIAAQTALRHGNDTAADVLVDRLDPADGGPYPSVIKGELAYRRRQLRRSEELFGEIDLADLAAVDPGTAGFVVRRLATLRYQLHADYRGAIDWLADREQQLRPELAMSLRAHRVTLLTLLGCADEALATAEPLLDDATGTRAIEIHLARARALVLRGELDLALAIVGEQRAAIDGVRLTGPEAGLPAEGALSITLTAMVDRGDVLAAERLLHDNLVIGGRTSRTWSPLSAADVAIEVGRARTALELIRPALEMYRANGMDNGRLSCLAMQARAFAEVGRPDAAERALAELAADLDLAVGANRWFVAAAMARAVRIMGGGAESVDLLLEQADVARGWGARGAAANLLALAAVVGERETAETVVDRLGDLTSAIDGRLWPIRLAHVTALADGSDLGPVREAYLGLGYRSFAALTAEPTPERAAAGPT